MILLLGILFIGLFIGFFLRKQQKLEKYLDIIIMIAIYSLLFFIGISVGSNKLIINNLAQIGINAFFLTIFAVAGTSLLSVPVYKHFFKNRTTKHDK